MWPEKKKATTKTARLNWNLIFSDGLYSPRLISILKILQSVMYDRETIKVTVGIGDYYLFMKKTFVHSAETLVKYSGGRKLELE